MNLENLFNSIRNNTITLEQFTSILKTEFTNCENFAFESLFDSLNQSFDYFLLDNNLNSQTINYSNLPNPNQFSPQYFNNFIS